MRKFGVFLVLISTAAPCFAVNRFSILQGATSNTESHFTVLAKADEPLQFRARPDGRPGMLVNLSSDKISYPGSEWVVYRLKAKGLSANQPYALEILDDQARLLEVRKFEALDVNKKGGKIAVGSCMVRQLHNPGIWESLAEPRNRPDVLMITGDIVYLDRANVLKAKLPESGLEVWEEFVKARQVEGLYFWDHLVPTLTVWDDHDSGGDNVDSSWHLMPEVLKIYETFLANEEIPGFLEHGPGMAKQFQLFGKNFIFLDGRSFRNAWLTNPMFGEEQDRWMLRKVQPGANFLVSGTQFFGGPIKKDSMEYNWPAFHKEWMEKLRRHGEWKGAAFVFISGDVHFSEVQDIEPIWLGYPTVEITSSNIHSFGFPGHFVLKPDNPRRRVVTGTHNIVLLEFDPGVSDFQFLTRSLGWRGNDLFRTVVSVYSPYVKSSSAAMQPCERALMP